MSGAQLTGRDVATSLRAANFQSRYLPTLDATYIPYPGYHSGSGAGVENDEVHNDFAHQYLFPSRDEEEEEDEEEAEPVQESAGAHGILKQHVYGGRLWYVLLHGKPQPWEDLFLTNYVVLFAVGRSLHGDRLLGVVSHQVCHNLCD
jgi:hypothetical protein